jgi:hypothetical protein
VGGVALFALCVGLAAPSILSATGATVQPSGLGSTLGSTRAAAGILSSSALRATPSAAPVQTTAAQETSSTSGQGYWLVASDGGIFSFGDAGYFGSTGSITLNKPIVGMAATPDGQGYWLVASDGGIFSFGDAKFFGSTGSITLNKPIVGMAATPDGQGYWLVASDGGIFSFGDAKFFGSTGSITLNKPIVGMSATTDGKGYWLVASDGGIFSFGDAKFLGSTGSITLNKPIVGMAATSDSQGYWLVASDGGIFSFGDAGYFGSDPAAGVQVGDVVALASASDGQGYWIAGGNGGVNPFGGAASDGSAAGEPLNRPIVGFSAAQPSIPGLESPAPLAVSTTSLPNASVGVPYGATLAASGGTPSYSWTLTSGALPAGLNITPNGAISGTPGALGHASFTLEVTDSTAPTAMTAAATLSIVVGVAPLTVTTKNLPNAIIGTSYSASLSASGGTAPYSWHVAGGSLPAGLSLSSNGLISGTPAKSEGASFTVQVTDSSTPTPAKATATLSLPVFPNGSTSCATVPPTSCEGSNNWSGYMEQGGPFTEATGTFSVPSIVPGTPATDLMAEWVGIDGGGGTGQQNLIQAGFNETPEPGTTAGFEIQPWWEILPASETYISSVRIAAGDHVTVVIDQIGGTNWSITLTDDTNGETFTTDQTYGGPGTSAEWIVEALSTDQNGQDVIANLAPYSPVVSFGDLGFVAATASLEELVMYQKPGTTQVSTPSRLTANGFNVAYGPTAPAPP